MKLLFQKISAVFMSAIVLLSTVSMTVDMHYCGDRLVDLAFFKEARSCGMEQQMAPTNSCGDSVERKSCCSDKQIVLEGQDELKNNVVKLTFKEQVFIASYVYSYVSLFENTPRPITSFDGRPPPLLEKDYQVLYETFLI